MMRTATGSRSPGNSQAGARVNSAVNTANGKLLGNPSWMWSHGNPIPVQRLYRFGDFTLDAHTGELARNGNRTPLREQPLQLLLALLERPGELISARN
jgi:DNA-binding response OmpR family regulator